MSYSYKDKLFNQNRIISLMLSKTNSMFEWGNLPDIPQRSLEKLLQTNGFAFIYQHENKFYALNGGLCGLNDAYGEPTQITICEQSINLNKTIDLKDGVLLINDSNKTGIKHIIEKYAFMICENDINLVLNGYNTRSNKLISAGNDRTKQSAEAFLKKIVDGELAIITESTFHEDLKLHSQQHVNSSQIPSFIQYSQHLKTALYNELGIPSNELSSIKKASLLENELQQNLEMIYPLIFNMLQCRQKAVLKVNEKFGLNISVNFGGLWASLYGSNFETQGSKAMQLNEYMESGDLWGNIKSVNEIPNIINLLQEFDTNKLNRQQAILYGERELFSKFEMIPIEEIAELILMQYAQKWETLNNMTFLDAGVTKKQVEKKTSTEQINTTEKVSALNESELVPESGGNKIQENTLVNEQEQHELDAIVKSLTQAEKLSILNILLKDVANFLTLSTYNIKEV